MSAAKTPDLDALKKKISNKGMHISDVAEAMGIDKAVLRSRFDGDSEFMVSEIYRLADVLELSDAEKCSIFFGKVELNSTKWK